MKKTRYVLFHLVTLFYKIVTVVLHDYTAENPAFVNFSKFSGDTLQHSHGRIIYSALIFRHGNIFPAFTYPTDPYRNYSFPRKNYAMLTKVGKLRLNEVGQYFKGRYSSLTGATYDHKKIKIITSYNICIMQSAECFLSGYFPTTQQEIWNPYVHWQPIPVHTIPPQYDNIIHFSKKCPINDQLTRKFYETSTEVKNICREYKSFFNYIERNSGLNLHPCEEVHTFRNLQTIYQIFAEDNTTFNITLPSWVKSIYPEPVTSIVGRTFLLQVNDPQIKKIFSGPFFRLLLSEMKAKVNKSTSVPRLHLFSARAETLITFMRTLNVYDNVVPPFGSSLGFELRQKNDDNYYITLMYTNSTEKEPYLIEIPECGTYCTLQNFETILSSIIPKNWNNICEGSSDESLKEMEALRSSQSEGRKSNPYMYYYAIIFIINIKLSITF